MTPPHDHDVRPSDRSFPRAAEVLARGMIRDQSGRLLLVRHRKRGWWFAPGGHLERGESISQALQRELQEEAEMKLRVTRLIGVTEHAYEEDGEQRTELNLLLEAQALTPIGKVEEHLEFGWFNSDELQEVEIRPNNIATMLRDTEHRSAALATELRDLA